MTLGLQCLSRTSLRFLARGHRAVALGDSEAGLSNPLSAGEPNDRVPTEDAPFGALEVNSPSSGVMAAKIDGLSLRRKISGVSRPAAMRGTMKNHRSVAPSTT